MPWIETIGVERAVGPLKQQLEKALARAGRVWNIVGIMSQNARTLEKSMDFYAAVMFGRSPLSRGRREMLAVVTSAANGCVY